MWCTFGPGPLPAGMRVTKAVMRKELFPGEQVIVVTRPQPRALTGPALQKLKPFFDCHRFCGNEQVGRSGVEASEVGKVRFLQHTADRAELGFGDALDVKDRSIPAQQFRRAFDDVELHAFDVDLEHPDAARQVEAVERNDVEVSIVGQHEVLRAEVGGLRFAESGTGSLAPNAHALDGDRRQSGCAGIE